MSPAPYPEQPGYSAQMGFVKNNPLNNDYYVKQWVDDPWYEIIAKTHDELTRKFPGYNISQIKEKFGGLRYYISKGTCSDEIWANNKEAYQIIRRAEAEVDKLSRA